jgi:hypothetical protein
MLIQEMHNKVEVRLQKMASHVYDWIQSEQVDSFINDNILAYVKNKSNTSSLSGKAPFHRDMKNLEDLRTLVVDSPDLRAYIKDEEFMTVRYPGDHLITVTANINSSDICNYPNGFPAPLTEDRYSAAFDLPYNVKRLAIGVQDIISFPGFQDPDLAFLNHNLLHPVLNNEYGDIYFRNNRYLFVQKPGQELPDLTITTVNELDEETETVIPFTVAQQNYYGSVVSGKTKHVRIINTEEFAHYMNHPFAWSTANNPSGYVVNDVLEIHTAKRFILSKVSLIYIRKPAKVNLSLNISCDLPEHTHEEIVDRTVADILETIESGRLQGRVSLNTLNE